MKERKLQVFVSSTFTDLKEERQAAVEAILSSGHIPAGMELFTAGDEKQMTVIERWIDESDVYLLILGGRYGSIEPKTGKSYTHLEYEYALAQNKSLFAVVIDENIIEERVKSKGLGVFEKENPKLLSEFRQLVMSNLVKQWVDTKDIKIAIHETLHNLSYKPELIGWIRGDNLVNTGALAEEIARLTKENSELRSKMDGLNSAIYSGLNYSELSELLRKNTITYDGKKSNAFEYFIEFGNHFIGWYRVTKNEELEVIKKLQFYKLVFPSQGSSYTFKFTEDGHNFYLKCLSVNSL